MTQGRRTTSTTNKAIMGLVYAFDYSSLALGRSNDCKINIESNDYSLYLPWVVMVPLLNLE
jgi:hypothetical protein